MAQNQCFLPSSEDTAMQGQSLPPLLNNVKTFPTLKFVVLLIESSPEINADVKYCI